MSKRVYEIARDLNLSSKEVIERLNAAGIEVKSNFAVVQDPIVERVFGEGSEGDASDGTASNGRSQGQDAETLLPITPSPPRASRSMIAWLRKSSLPARVLLYAAAAVLAFAIAVGVGAMTTLIVQGNLSLPESAEPRPSGEQGNSSQEQGADADRLQQEEAAAQTSKAGENNAPPSQEIEAEYVGKVGDIQSKSVETFLDSHDKFMRYDALSADDIEEMHTNQGALKGFVDQVDDLDPPQKYKEHYEVFRSAINELYEATNLAYNMAADPTAATISAFDEHDRLVDQAAAHLQQSNKMLGRDYRTLEGAPMEEVSRL